MKNTRHVQKPVIVLLHDSKQKSTYTSEKMPIAIAPIKTPPIKIILAFARAISWPQIRFAYKGIQRLFFSFISKCMCNNFLR